MKAFCDIVNLLAMVMVLLLGAASVHAHEPLQSYGTELANVAEVSEEHVEVLADSHPADDRSMHCGAPMLGPTPVSLGCVITVAEVVYPNGGIATAIDVTARDLRPPRS